MRSIAHPHADKRLTANVGIIQRQHHDRRHRPAHRQDDPTGRPRHNRQGRTRTALAQLRRRSAARRPGSTRAFPSWFLRITCDRCGGDRMLNEAHMLAGDMTIREIIKRVCHDGCRVCHDGCGGRAARVELLTGRDVLSRRVRNRYNLQPPGG
jgi:hypothetical protein